MQPDPARTTGRPRAALTECLHETFARMASARPGTVALIEGDRAVTYGELDRLADAGAAELVQAGIGPGDIVPVLLPRSVELVSGLLSVLKAGAAYALLDPSWPARRIHEVVQDLAPSLMVTGAEGETLDGPAPPVWSPPAEPAPVPPGFRPAQVSADGPACVFFTSGTTGRPKGVVTPHRAISRLFRAGELARFGADTVMPLAAPVPWDAFSLELWAVLLNGGTSLIVADPYLSVDALRSGVAGHGMDTVWLTSSLFNMIVDEDLAAFAGLKLVMTGGERLSCAHVRRFLRRHPGITLLNGYGPVESTIFATTHRVTEADCDGAAGIPLGRPVPGTGVYVLDGTRLCAAGEVGEICLSGEGLALHYLGDPVLTGEKFTRLRVSDVDLRIYHTGDLGMWDPHGLLQFRGRIDRQLKIRGHRVEPAEVERQIEHLLPAVRACRLLSRADRTGTAQELVVFCVPEEPGDPLHGAMSVLNSSLVSYQRPAALVCVDAFPMTPQGKLDEPALLSLAPSAPSGPSAFDRPADGPTLNDTRRTDRMVQVVAETFSAVLGRQDVPLDATFVQLGGTSLAAGRVCARLSGRLDRPVPVSLLYGHPTVSALARRLRTEPLATPAPAAAPGTAVPLTPMQVMYLTRQLAVPTDRTAHCLLTWVVKGHLDYRALQAAVATVHRRHETLRAAYVPDPHPSALLVDLPAPDLETLPEEASVDLAVRALRRELSDELQILHGEVWRIAVVPVVPVVSGPTEPTAVLGCLVHHIAFDGWSEAVLARDLAAAYDAALRAVPVTAPSPPSMAAVHRDRIRREAQIDTVAHHDFVIDELEDTPEIVWPSAPADRGTDAIGRVEATLAPATVAHIDALAARMGVTRFVALLANWAAGLADVTGQRDFAVGVPVARRDELGLERAIGCHIDMLCLRLRGTALAGGADAVKELASLVTRARAAQDVPIGDVLSLVDPPRTGRPPLYQTIFALQDNALPVLELPGLRTAFLRQPYLDLPTELHAELWPDEGGGQRLEISFRTDAVCRATAEELAKHFTHRLRLSPVGGPL